MTSGAESPPRHLDYDFLAIRLMYAFGWTIEYTLSLTLPVFISLSSLLMRARLDNAVESFYVPYGAAKYGKDCVDTLFDGRGSFYLEEQPDYTYNEEDLATAQARMARIQEEQRKRLEGAVENQ